MRFQLNSVRWEKPQVQNVSTQAKLDGVNNPVDWARLNKSHMGDKTTTSKKQKHYTSQLFRSRVLSNQIFGKRDTLGCYVDDLDKNNGFSVENRTQLKTKHWKCFMAWNFILPHRVTYYKPATIALTAGSLLRFVASSFAYLETTCFASSLQNSLSWVGRCTLMFHHEKEKPPVFWSL